MIRGFGEEALDARLEEFETIARRNNERDAGGGRGNRVVHAPVGAFGGADGGGDAGADEVLADDFFGGTGGVAFRTDDHGGGAGDAAPVVENFRNVADALGAVRSITRMARSQSCEPS